VGLLPGCAWRNNHPSQRGQNENRGAPLAKSVTASPVLRRRAALFSVEQHQQISRRGRKKMKRAWQLAEILQHGMAAHRDGRLAEAERSYQAVLETKRNDFDSLHLLGVVRWQQRRHEGASKLITQALRVRPDSAEACANLGMWETHLRGEAPKSFRVEPN
jgi:Flp pilus assembly protein TadD